MNKKRFLVLGSYMSLLALVACGPKVIDDSDLVSVDYIYSFSDGTVIDSGSKEFVIGDNKENKRIESVIRGAKKDDEFTGTINGNEIYGSEYDKNKIQSYANIILTEVLGVSNPTIGTDVFVGSLGTGTITNIEKDSDGYDAYVVNFNDPKTYSELSYSIKVINVEKN